MCCSLLSKFSLNNIHNLELNTYLHIDIGIGISDSDILRDPNPDPFGNFF